ncbi:hypothetical protein ACS0TY_001477 [Phlomoides rotata]
MTLECIWNLLSVLTFESFHFAVNVEQIILRQFLIRYKRHMLVGVAAFDLRSASFDLSQYIETSSSYQNTKTLLNFYDPMVIIVTPAKTAPDGMVGVSELVDRFCSSTTKVIMARGCFDDTRGAALVISLAANEPSALGLDSYSKQYYLCLAAAAATIKWIEAEKGLIITNHSLSKGMYFLLSEFENPIDL